MKTRMSGLFQDYQKMFKTIMNWDTEDSDPRYYSKGTHPILGNEDGHYLCNAGYALSDMGYHGWEGEAAQNEITIYNKIQLSYLYLLIKQLKIPLFKGLFVICFLFFFFEIVIIDSY